MVLAKATKVGQIEKGLFVLIGVGEKDTLETAERLARKLARLRLMADGKGKINLDVEEAKAKVLVVSQFTLLADTSKGNRPSFINAALPEKAKEIYEWFIAKLKSLGVEVETGSFGEYMEIETSLDGPVTIVLED